MANQTFHHFPDLPRELRDEIWRQCLPHRVVELDFPDPDYLSWRAEQPHCHPFAYLSCELWSTSRRNYAMPTITRVCHESRKVALEAVDLALIDHTSSLSMTTDKNRRPWIDPVRDTLHLHWHPRLSEPTILFTLDSVQQCLSLGAKFHNASLCADLLDSVYRRYRRAYMDFLVDHPSWSICVAYVSIHATEEAAVRNSELWGMLGEERIVLVDARDTKRVAEFRDFWNNHGTMQDNPTAAFFDACVDGVPKIHYLETPEEFLQDLEIRWLHDYMPHGEENVAAFEELQNQVWLMTPGDFDGKEDDPRQADYGDLPGRPFARQLWSPNRDHPWVRNILGKMPNLQPTIMFRLCTNKCLQV